MRRRLDLRRTSPEPGPDADERSHEWAGVVDLDDADLAGPALLELHGIATAWDVLVNDAVVARGRSMFAPHVVDVAPVLRLGANDVVVRVHPLTDLLDAVPRRPRARWRTALVDEARLRWVRTTVLGRAPGFAPGPPVVGPHRPVVLRTREAVRVMEFSLRTRVERDGAGVVVVEARLEALAGALEETVTVEVTGPSGSARADLPVVDGVARGRVVLAAPALWWPHTHGTPALHDVRLRHGGELLDLPGDDTVAPDVRRVGFRALVDAGEDGAVALELNGVPVFARGAVWTPGSLAALDEAVALGLNLVRVSGVAGWESDAFHARCDELGLLVWHDLPLATFDYPLADDAFAEALVGEVDHHVRRLADHPSTVVVCGSAEHEQQAALFGTPLAGGAAGELAALLRPVVAATGIDAAWVDSSPSGGVPPTRVDTGVAQYFGVGAYRRDLPDVRHAGVRFAAECLAFSHLPDGARTDVGVPRDNGADWDFADVRRHYLARRHGAQAGLEDEQRVTGEVMAEVMGEWRRPASPCAGAVVLWLRDLEPGAGWGLLDHEGRPKPAARVLAPVLAPTAVWIVDEGHSGLDVHLAHDPPDPVDGVLRVELRRDDGSVVEAAEQALVLPGHGHRVVGVEALLGRFADAAWAHRFGPAAHDVVVAELVLDDGRRRTASWRVPRA